MQPAIVLRKVRDFGERIGDSLLFLKLNWKNLLVIYLVFAVPFFLIGAIVGGNSMSGLFSLLSSRSTIPNFGDFGFGFFLWMLLLLLAITSYCTAVYSYMRLYEQKGGEKPSLPEVGKLYMSKFFSNLLYTIVITALFIVGIFIVIIPILGVLAYLAGLFYFSVIFSILFPVNTIEDHSFGAAFSRCFYLIKERWWFSFGYSIIIFLIYYFFALVIGLIIQTIFGFSAINMTDPERIGSAFEKYAYVLALSTIFQYVFYLILHIGLGIHYYSLLEEKDGSGLEARLDQLGEQSGPHSNIEEQY